MPIAFSYLRFSSEKQSQGHSIERQEGGAEEYAKKHGLTLDPRTFRDLGVSAFKGKNVREGALGVFLRAVDEGTIPSDSILLVESLDRVTRTSVMEAVELFTSIVNRGITLITVSDGSVYSKATIEDNWTKLIISIAIFARGNEESVTKSKRVTDSWTDKKNKAKSSKKVMTARTPHWIRATNHLTKTDEKGKPIRVVSLDQDRARLVKRIIGMAEKGIGNHTIIRTLHAEAVNAWSKSKKWEPSYIQKLLSNPALYGAIEIDGDLVDDYYPAVITKNRFLYLQSLRSARATTKNTNRKGKTVTNLFSGFLKCGYCGSAMNIAGYKSRVTGYERKYVACHGARIGATECQMKMWFIDELEPALLFWITTIDYGKVIGATKKGAIDNERERLATVEHELADAQKRAENTMVAIEEGALSMVPRLKQHEADVSSLKKELEAQRRKVLTLESQDGPGASRMKHLIMLYKALKNTTEEVALRALREQLSAAVASAVSRIVLFPAGHKRTGSKEDRFIDVTFVNGATRRIEPGEC